MCGVSYQMRGRSLIPALSPAAPWSELTAPKYLQCNGFRICYLKKFSLAV